MPSRADSPRGFFDEAVIEVRGGHGGGGSAHLRREKYVARGGPDGGDGGRGGDVVVRARSNVHALTQFRFRRRFHAGDGRPGDRNNRSGRAGESLVIDVPPGTVVYDQATGARLADLVDQDGEVLVAHGGRGGWGNVHFKSSRFQTPEIAMHGDPGEERRLRLELELIADAGLVGAPNAGKSSVLARLSAARPKIAPYPFTTLEPVLGVVTANDTSFVLADLPGLIEGAGDGAGLGHQFLRHARRSRVLVHVIDGAGLERDPRAAFRATNAELEGYDPTLAERPQLVAFNKTDLAEAREKWPDFRDALQADGHRVISISAATGESLRELVAGILQLLRDAPEPRRAEPSGIAVLRPPAVDEEPRLFRRSDGAFVVRDPKLELLAARLNLETRDAADYLQRQLDRLGVTKRLEQAGVGDTDTVVIGDVEFEWSHGGL